MTILSIIFSYNRAMQLDLLLRSLELNMKVEGIKYIIIYDCSPSHEKSYDILVRYWSHRKFSFKRLDGVHRSALSQVIRRGRWDMEASSARSWLEHMESAPEVADEVLEALKANQKKDMPPKDKWRC